MKKVRHIIGAVLLPLGMLICLGAVGRLDYLADCAELSSGDVREAIIKSIVGVVLMGAAACFNHDLEYDE